MKIAVCDDNVKDLVLLEHLLKKYQKLRPGTKFETETFTEPSKLTEHIQNKKLADIYILDILMSEITGIEIGKQIRTSGQENVIIYTTSSDDFALEAYNIHAVRYLLKPLEEAKFFESLDYAFSHKKKEKGPVFSVKTKNGLVSVPCSSIEYIENASRMLDIHLTNGEQLKSIFIRKSFEEELGALIHHQDFIQVHKSFFVNLNYINKLEGNNAVMDSGTSIPISKKNFANVKRKYLLFVSEQYR